MRAVVLFSHGSLLCGAGEALEAHVLRLRERGIADRVAIGYLNYSLPLFAQAVAELVDEGVDEIVVVPYFLAPGYFVNQSLPECVDAARAAHPGVVFQVSGTLGDTQRLCEAVLASAETAMPPERWDEPLLRAVAGCRLRSDCPLYGTAGCASYSEAAQ